MSQKETESQALLWPLEKLNRRLLCGHQHELQGYHVCCYLVHLLDKHGHGMIFMATQMRMDRKESVSHLSH